MKETLDREGHVTVDGLASTHQCAALISAVEKATASHLLRGESIFGARNLLNNPDIRAFARSPAVRSLVGDVLGTGAVPVRGLFFDKTPDANWPVAWHQDLTLAMRERHDVDGWTNWSVKGGVAHVQPPADVLAHMLTLRLHLDECGEENGPLRVLSGSHRHGRLTREAQRSLREANPETVCCANKGAALLMRPLLMHASSAAKCPGHRRVLHVEFAAADVLPRGLSWQQLDIVHVSAGSSS